MLRKNLRLEDGLSQDITSIAKEKHMSENQLITEAVKLYRDYHFANNKACFLNEELIHILQASYNKAEQTINNKTNTVLSELAIQACMQNLILANSLDVTQAQMNTYRLQAIDFLKEKNRVLRLDEVVK